MRDTKQTCTASNPGFNVAAFNDILAAQKRVGIDLSPEESIALMLQVSGKRSLNDSVACIRAGLEKTGTIKNASHNLEQAIVTQLLSSPLTQGPKGAL